MTEKSEFTKRPVLAVMAQSAALVAALFVLALSVLLIADHVRLLKMDPLNDPVLLELRGQLAGSAEMDEALAERIRTFDLYARRAFFSGAEQRRTGGILILGAAAVCFTALKLSRSWQPILPSPGKGGNPDHRELNSLFRQLMAGTGILLAVVSLFLAFTTKSDLALLLAMDPAQRKGGDAGAASPEAGLLAEMKKQWPSLRGWGNIGRALPMDTPVSWDVESGEGVLWKTDVPVHGFNSPIVWNEHLFLSGGDEEGFEVFCYDTESGEQRWTRTVDSTVELPAVSEDTGFAAPSMATDGKRVFVIFATGDLAAFDFEGNPVWQQNVGRPSNPYGMGSSLISDGLRLFVQYDHKDSRKVIALDGATGERIWQMMRPHISWSSPALIETRRGMQLVLNDEEFVTAYDPATGKLLWQIKCLGGEVAPSPAFNGQDVVFVANEYAQASALRLTGSTPEILWQYDEFLPEISSPVAAEDRFFITTSAGDIVCLDSGTGEVKWEHECDEGFSSSPVLVGSRIYTIDLGGVVYIFDAAADSYHEIAAIEMGEPVYATPAFLNSRIYIRGDKKLYCIGNE